VEDREALSGQPSGRIHDDLRLDALLVAIRAPGDDPGHALFRLRESPNFPLLSNLDAERARVVEQGLHQPAPAVGGFCGDVLDQPVAVIAGGPACA
jgi:hypothetical protein